MPVFNDVAQAMQSILGEQTDQLAKETGFIKRERKARGYSTLAITKMVKEHIIVLDQVIQTQDFKRTMEVKFSDLSWHDAHLLDIRVDGRNPGECDQIVINICWPSGQQNELIFSDCFGLEARMNFGIIAPESILNASQIDESQELAEMRNKWAEVGIDLGKLKCFEIKTNSTNSLVRVYALNFSF